MRLEMVTNPPCAFSGLPSMLCEMDYGNAAQSAGRTHMNPPSLISCVLLINATVTLWKWIYLEPSCDQRQFFMLVTSTL